MSVRFAVALLLCSSLLASALKTSPPPLPTADLLQWSRQEIGVLIHFNMATYLDHDGCGPSEVPDVKLFNPALLNTDQWVRSMQDLGAKYAVLVAKHGCGFTLWPSRVSVPAANFTYNYTVANSGSPQLDVVRNFVTSCENAGIRTGYYYSVVSNSYLNVQNGQVQNGTLAPGQVSVSQDTYNQVALMQLKELWGNYGSQGLDEIWFDGGYTSDLKADLTRLLENMQPHAAVFNGYGVTNNAVRWIGTEAGAAPDPNWSTGTTSDGGDPNSGVWCPGECDTTLQNSDRWFWNKDVGLRSLSELIGVYHKTVGRNCQLMMDFTPDRNGLIPAAYAARYKQLGDFIRSCYGSPVVSTGFTGITMQLTLGQDYRPFAVDRVVLQEDQTYGQRVRAYKIDVLPYGGPGWVNVANGTSIGNKKIDLFDQAYNAQAVRITVGSAIDTPVFTNFAAHLCDQF